MASGNLLDRLVWQFRHLWRGGNKARLSIESDHDGNAYASLHVDLGQGRRRPRQDPPPLPTHPPKSRHSQTQPINISKELNQSTQVVMTGKGFTPCESVGTQASDTVEVATDTVEDTIISVENNESNEPVETLAEVVIHNSDNSSQPTITLSCGENGNEGMKGVVSEVTDDDLEEEEEAEFEDATDDIHDDESLGLLPIEEGANVTFLATPLGKKVVTEGREEGPDEGELWRLAMSRRRPISKMQLTIYRMRVWGYLQPRREQMLLSPPHHLARRWLLKDGKKGHMKVNHGGLRRRGGDGVPALRKLGVESFSPLQTY